MRPSLLILLTAASTLTMPLSPPANAQETTHPNPMDHRAGIRAALLKATPLGSSVRDVCEFIKKNLVPEGQSLPPVEDHPVSGGTADSAKKGSKSIRYLLGSYIDNPAIITLAAPLLLQKEVTVQWAFDDHDRLIEIFVDKQTATY